MHLLDHLKRHNACLQLRRAISIQAEGKKLLEKHAIAQSAARLCWMSPSLIDLFDILRDDMFHDLMNDRRRPNFGSNTLTFRLRGIRKKFDSYCFVTVNGKDSKSLSDSGRRVRAQLRIKAFD